jgi:hypothetical protein
VRGAELDAAGPGLEQRFDLGGDLPGGPGEREAIEDRVGHKPARSLMVTGADQPLYRG